MDKTIDKKEIYLERRKRLLLWGIPAAVGIAALSVLLYNIAPTVSSRDITVGTAERGPIEITVAATGRIVAAYEEIINSPVESRVLSVYAQPGDSVKAGMPLLLLDLEQEQTELGKLQDARTMQEQQLCQIQLSNMTDISDRELSHFRNANLGFVFQSFHLIPTLDVAANVEIPLLYRKGVSARQRRERVEQVLERLEMSHRIHHLPTQLSGGQSQRVAIARAIVGNPQIVLADEPTGNLDSKMGAEVMSLLQRLNKEDGTTIIMVTHNEMQAQETDRIVRFFDGRIMLFVDKIKNPAMLVAGYIQNQRSKAGVSFGLAFHNVVADVLRTG